MRRYRRGLYIPSHYDPEYEKMTWDTEMERQEHNRKIERQKADRYRPPKNVPIIHEKKSWWPF
jgi:hypothetical protein